MFNLVRVVSIVFICSLVVKAFGHEDLLLQQKKMAFVRAMSAVVVKYNPSDADPTVTSSTMLRRTLKEIFGGRFEYALADAIAMTPDYMASGDCELIIPARSWAHSTVEYIRVYDPRAINDIRGLISDAIHCK